MLLFILHPAREIVTAVPAVMLFPVPVAIKVESNIFAPAPTVNAGVSPPVATNLHRLAVPLNNPALISSHSVKDAVPETVPPSPPKL